MRWSPSPDLTSPRRLALATLGASAAVWAILVLLHPDITTRLGDTDDAMRLFLVRDLLHGRGWYDQRVTRLAPPLGVWMHWSRLLDGAIGGMDWVLGRVMPPEQAEWAMRFFWPLLWVPVATGSALVIARKFGARAAVFMAVPLFVTLTPMLYRQFTPGRIDHHNVQISMALLALAGAITAGASPPPQRLWPAVLAGAAGGLGLAVGLEALPFHALIGLSFGLRLALDKDQARICAAYGAALGVSSLGLYLLQTPPPRWGLSFCDAIGLNLVLALAIAGAGLFLVASLSERLPTAFRLGLLTIVGLAAGGSYLAADPACIAGPFAGLDPRIGPLWLDRVQEVQPLSRLFATAPGLAGEALTALVMVSLAAGFLLWRALRAGPRQTRYLEAVPAMTLAASLVLADVAGWEAWRMFDYVYWIGAPTLAAALSYLAARVAKDRMVPTVAISLCLSPLFVGGAAGAAAVALSPKDASRDAGVPLCSEVKGFAPLAALPAGVVLSEINLGPHLIANTPHTAIAAPYHRLAPSILAAHEAFAALPAAAAARVRALGATYVVDCPGSYMGVPAGSFGWGLRRGEVPAWLEPVPATGTKLVIYRVRPAAATAAPTAR
jgi:hypothetical protein